MSQFLKFAKQQYAEKLGIPAEEVEKWYDFVNKNFFIYITSSKFVHPNAPETFSATLHYSNDDDDCETSTHLIGFQTLSGQSEFNTPEEALDIALQKVNNIEFTRDIHFVVFCDIPFNALILFDTWREKRTANADKMSRLSHFMQQQYAEKLKVPVEEIEELYNFVQKHFYLSINATPLLPTEKPQRFYSRLWFRDDDDAYIITEYDKKAPFSTPSEALKKALAQVPLTTFSYFTYFPTNILILFDTERERKRIIEESSYFKH